MGKWISCEERLPDVYIMKDIFGKVHNLYSDSVLVTMETEYCDGSIDRTVSSDILIESPGEGKRWLMSCGYSGGAVVRQKIVAWMPMPTAYDEVLS